MAKIHIVTDSMCHIPSALCQELGIHVVPLPYVWEGVSYLDDTIGPREFYARLRASRTVPSTSGPTPGSFKEQFETLGSDGDPLLAITVGEEFSSTHSAAQLGKEMSSNVDVTVCNSHSNTMALGFQVLAAARAARDGADLNEVLSILDKVKDTCGIVFAVPHLEYLRRGGRISHLGQIFASTLKLVPIMEIRGGPIQPVERVRTQKKVLPRIVELVSDRIKSDRPLRLAIVHADAEATAWELAKHVREHFKPDELITAELTPVLGIHAGPDAIGLAYASGI